MPDSSDPKFGINSWLEDELYQQYLHDRKAVDETWKKVFDNGGNGAGVVVQKAATNGTNGAHAGNGSAAPAVPQHQPVASEQLIALRGPAARIADNMTASLSIPVATSQRIIPVKVLEENRRLLNDALSTTRSGKISFTHLIGWAIVKALSTNPGLNHAYAEQNGEPFRAVRPQVNLGLAVDVAGKDGARSLKVPNIKNAQAISFAEFLAAFDDVVARARTNKLTVPDFEGTTISLTNPGTVGTLGSVPRLMPGQGAIIATGAMTFGAEFQGVTDAKLADLGIGRVMMVTCTYDHRVIQGAESGAFLAKLQALLEGADWFYEEVFRSLHVQVPPVRWEADKTTKAPLQVDAAKQMGVSSLVDAYRLRGHLLADLDPLGSPRSYHPELDPAAHGLTVWDLDREFFSGDGQETAPLRDILGRLRKTYSGRIGTEYMYIENQAEKAWLQSRMEPTGFAWPLDNGARIRALERVIEAEAFERFLHTRFVGHKRFSVEGGEATLAILDEIFDRAANLHSVHEAVIAMAHRGRLTVLANLVGKSMVQVFSEFEGNVDPESTQGSGDVKYHLGASGVRKTSTGKEITVSVAFNPSHLEAVDPVVEGIVRPKQDRLGDTARERVLPILIHGDAAVAGQGVVAETLAMSQLPGFCTGGTIHLVINNQIGFTTLPGEARSGLYCTDIARSVQAPIFHVNGDDAEACVRVAQLAYDYRQQFKRDVVIDMVCYRRHGHNEGDDPSYTQPIMYKKIAQHPSIAKIYSDRLIQEKLVDASRVDEIRKGVVSRLNAIYDAAKQNSEKYELQELSAIDGVSSAAARPETAVDRAKLETVVAGITRFPENFTVHPKLKGMLEKRRSILTGASMDWALAETLAFGTLVLEGTPVRLSGQDTGRGTFSQRHLEYFDHEKATRYTPLMHLTEDQARFEVVNSFLSEYAVMGFEFGFSVADPLTLVLWEGQFGDFANGAQIIIDQFISSAEPKWGQPSGLVLLLPHGYEGQGPEHSSARIERFLQLSAENNMQVANCSTPAQYFHLLRRQMHGGVDRRGMRKPLIIFTPKRALRHARAVSPIEDLITGGFHEALPDTAQLESAKVQRILICSGQVYYDLLAAREDRKIDNIAILRLEQYYPFPEQELRDLIARYPATAEVCWVQEESANMGAWPFLQRLLPEARYIGRPASASPSAGSLKRHQQEQAAVVDEAFAPATIKPAKRKK